MQSFSFAERCVKYGVGHLMSKTLFPKLRKAHIFRKENKILSEKIKSLILALVIVSGIFTAKFAEKRAAVPAMAQDGRKHGISITLGELAEKLYDAEAKKN